jgi:PAS domain S-box-containing protein
VSAPEDRVALSNPRLASTDELALAMAELPYPVFVFTAVRDADGTVVELTYAFLNGAAARLYGMSVGEVLGHGQLELFPSVRELGIWDSYLGVLESGSPASLDAPWFREHGVEGSFRLAVSRFGDGLLVSARDTTEQRQAETALAADRATLRATVDSLLDPQIRFEAVRDEDDHIVDFVYADANPAACAYDKMTHEELVGTRLLTLLPGHLGTGLLEMYARVVDTGEPLMLDDYAYDVELLGGRERRFDIRGARVGDGLTYTFRDVTDRHEVAQSLAESEEHYRLLAENASDVVFMTGPDRRVVWIAPTVTPALGWDPEELVGRQMADLLRPQDEVETMGDRFDLYAGRNANPDGGYLIEMRTKWGEYRWLSGYGRALSDAEGNPLGAVSGLRDVTDVIQARQRAQAGEAILRATVDSLLDPQVRLDPVRDEGGQIVDFVYADANPAACGYHGLDYDDLVGARLLDLLPGSPSGAGLFDQYLQVMETGEPLVLDDVVSAQELNGGQVRQFDVRAARVNGGLTYTWRDVTDRHEVARRLAESEEQYRLLAENASDVVMRLSTDRKFEWVSGSVAGVLGRQGPDLIDHVIDEFVHSEDLPQFRQALAYGGPESPANVEFRFRRSDDTYRWVGCRTRELADEHGRPLGVVGGLVDISERKLAQATEQARLRELEQFQRLTVGRELKMIELKKEIEYLGGLAFRTDEIPAGEIPPAPEM